MIFNYLGPASSVCLGLTTKQLWKTYSLIPQISYRDPIPLSAFCNLPPYRCSGKHLYQLLSTWVPPHLSFNVQTRKFVSELVKVELTEANNHGTHFRMEQRRMRWKFAWKRECLFARLDEEIRLGIYDHSTCDCLYNGDGSRIKNYNFVMRFFRGIHAMFDY